MRHAGKYMRDFIRPTTALALPLLLVALFSRQALAGSPITVEDYGAWESLEDGALSPDGNWLAYAIRRENGEHELRIHDLAGEDELRVAAHGFDPSFSDDSKWLAYTIGLHEDEREKLEQAKKPVYDKMGLLDLTTGETEEFEDVASFAFSHGGRFLARRGYPAEETGGEEAEGEEEGGGEEEAKERPGHDLVVRDLASGHDINFGNVLEFAWQDEGTLLALTIAGRRRAGNGVLVFDPVSGVLRVLESGKHRYSRICWREDADDLAALRSREDEGYEGDTHAVLAWKALSEKLSGPDGSPAEDKLVYDPRSDPLFPAETRIVDFRELSWAKDGSAVFFGIKPWDKKIEKTEERASPGKDEAAGASAGETDEKEQGESARIATVEIWHAKDVRVVPEQKLEKKRERERNFLAVWHPESGQFVRLGLEPSAEAWPAADGATAIGVDVGPYQFAGLFGRGKRDILRIDTTTGQREMIVEGLPGGREFGDSMLQTSPDGRFLLYLKDDHFWSYDLRAGNRVNLTADLPTVFVDHEDDHPTPQKPPFGVAGWTAEASVLIHDKYDLWRIAMDGSSALRLTDGSPQKIVHRYVELDPDEELVDLSKPIYLSIYGEWTKKYGYAMLPPQGSPADLRRGVWLDKAVDRLIKAEKAEIFGYVVQDFDDSPDFFVSGPELGEARRISETNPFQEDYAWGRSELVEFHNKQGDRLQGALFYPAGYEPGQKYPMIVYIYEKRSQVVHNYFAPSQRRPYNPTVFTSRGYFVLQPDIVFRYRDPGASALDCIESAVGKVMEKGTIDASRLGLVGHSWGGYESVFVATESDLFAAAVAGAPLTNFFSMYGSIFWNTGIPETGHFEVGQERMEVPFWKDVDAFVRNSPVFGVENLNTPLLMAFGDQDGSVDWHQGIEMYNAARRAGKDLVLLVYTGENHGLREKPNQIDYHKRVLLWLDHYLKGAEAPEWITQGISHLDLEKKLKEAREEAAAQGSETGPRTQL